MWRSQAKSRNARWKEELKFFWGKTSGNLFFFRDGHQEKCEKSHRFHHFIQTFHSCSAGIVSVIAPELLSPPSTLTAGFSEVKVEQNHDFFALLKPGELKWGLQGLPFPQQGAGSGILFHWIPLDPAPKPRLCRARLYHSALFAGRILRANFS